MVAVVIAVREHDPYTIAPIVIRDIGIEKVVALASTSDTTKQDSIEIQRLHYKIKQLEIYMQGNTSSQDTSIVSITHTSDNIHAFLSTSNLKFWLVDSGATDNMTFNLHMLSNMKASHPKQHISIANGTRVPINGTSKMNLFSTMIDALFIPSLSSNLLFVNKITK